MNRINEFFEEIKKQKNRNIYALYSFYTRLDISDAISNGAFIQTIVDACKKTALKTSTNQALDAFLKANLLEIISIVKKWDILTWYAVWWLSETNDPYFTEQLRQNPQLTRWNIYEWLHLLAGSITAFFKVESKDAYAAYYALETNECDLNWCVSGIAPTIFAIRDAHTQSTDWILAFFFVCFMQARRIPDNAAVFPNAQYVIYLLEKWIKAHAGRQPTNIYIQANKRTRAKNFFIWSCKSMKEPMFVEEDFHAKWKIFDMGQNFAPTLFRHHRELYAIHQQARRMDILERTQQCFINPFNPDDTPSVASKVLLPTPRALALNPGKTSQPTSTSSDASSAYAIVRRILFLNDDEYDWLLDDNLEYNEWSPEQVKETQKCINEQKKNGTMLSMASHSDTRLYMAPATIKLAQMVRDQVKEDRAFMDWLLLPSYKRTGWLMPQTNSVMNASPALPLIQANPANTANTASAARIKCTCNVADCPNFHSKQ
jgi:hypothetical protein